MQSCNDNPKIRSLRRNELRHVTPNMGHQPRAARGNPGPDSFTGRATSHQRPQAITGRDLDRRDESAVRVGQVAQIDSSRLHDGAREPMDGCEIGSKLSVHLTLYSIALSVRL